jgi:hypothetical protein
MIHVSARSIRFVKCLTGGYIHVTIIIIPLTGPPFAYKPDVEPEWSTHLAILHTEAIYFPPNKTYAIIQITFYTLLTTFFTH